MIVLDTNIVSEFMTSPPSEAVFNWLNQQKASSLYLTSITVAEIVFGLNVMPTGRRRRLLEEKFRQFVASAFEQRILLFDERAGYIYGDMLAVRQKLGRPMNTFDGQIAAIARSNGFSVATRNIKDFERCNIELINPFDHK